MAAGRYELASQSDGLGFRGVLGRGNTSLPEELTAELAGIRSWVVGRVGPADPSGQGKFTESKSSADSILALQDFVSPVAAFVRDRCRSALVTRSRLRTISVIGACGARTTDISRGSVQTFGRHMRAVIPTLKDTRPRADDDSRGYELDVA